MAAIEIHIDDANGFVTLGVKAPQGMFQEGHQATMAERVAMALIALARDSDWIASAMEVPVTVIEFSGGDKKPPVRH